MSEPVNPRRIGLGAGAIVALYVLTLLLVHEVPGRMLALVGGPDGGLARHGGITVRYRAPEGITDEELARRAGDIEMRRDGDGFVFEVPGVGVHQVPDIRAFFTGGGLEFREVLEGDYANEIARRVPWVIDATRRQSWDAPLPDHAVMLDVDQWQPEDGGGVHAVLYLRALDTATLRRTIDEARAHGWTPDPNTEIVFEYVEPYPDAKDPRPFWRTHEVTTEIAIDGNMIASAVGSVDPYMNRPIVLLDFDEQGADRFCELTRRITGRKLATLVAGVVKSAPIINGAICGGRASITMGGYDPQRQGQERDALVAVLRAGALPPGGIVERLDVHDRPALGRIEWAARLLGSVGAGILGGLLAMGLVVVVRPRWQRWAPAGVGGFPLRRALVTLAAPVALYAGGRLMLPGLNVEELAFALFQQPTSDLDVSGFSVIALGITPIMSGFIVVEVVSLVVPRWRRLRHVPLGRVAIGKAAAVASIVLALVQGYFVATYLESFGNFEPFLLTLHGWALRIAVMASLVAGTAVLAVVAGMIREHGLGNGYVALLVSGVLLDAWRLITDNDRVFEAGHALGLVAFVLVAAVSATVLRGHVGRDGELPLRVPASGEAPLGDGGGLALVIVVFGSVGLGVVLGDVIFEVQKLQTKTWLVLALCGVFAIGWSWLFARPRLVAGVAQRARLLAPSNATWWRAALASAAVLVAISAAARYAIASDGGAAFAAPLIGVLAGAYVLDVIADVRAHRGAVEPAWVLHQVQYAGAVENALAEAHIPCHLHGVHARTLLAFFGPFAPVIVLVPAEHATEARVRIGALFE